MMAPSGYESSRVRAMFAAIANRYDLANHLLSGGLDYLWRRRAAELVSGWNPTRILDLATGSGDLALTLGAACPGALLVSADFCHSMLVVAEQKGLERLVVADGLHLPFADATFDALTIAFGLRNMESWSFGLMEMARVLRTGGHLLVLEFSLPPPLLRRIYGVYLHRVLPVIAGLITGERGAYEYLAETIEKFPSGAKVCELLGNAGFSDAVCTPLSGGIVSLYTARR
jgi:demethylmenaquinone methyltransferase/2-methoxy-6-polyprenyl-1,4-benzoquinol methylase